ncbi:MAG: hypothetical protein WD598_16685 [Acidimicrobiia bacterium]
MPKQFVKKIADHDDLEPGEAVIDACYGLGKGVLHLADRIAPTRYEATADQATDDPAGSEAAKIDRTGILGVSDRRVLFFPVKTVLGRPKAVSAAWSFDQVAGAAYEKPMLTVTFADGSTGGLHVPRDGDALANAINERAKAN